MSRDQILEKIREACCAARGGDVDKGIEVLGTCKKEFPTGDFNGSCDENAGRSPWQAARFAYSAMMRCQSELEEGRNEAAEACRIASIRYLSYWGGGQAV